MRRTKSNIVAQHVFSPFALLIDSVSHLLHLPCCRAFANAASTAFEWEYAGMRCCEMRASRHFKKNAAHASDAWARRKATARCDGCGSNACNAVHVDGHHQTYAKGKHAMNNTIAPTPQSMTKTSLPRILPELQSSESTAAATKESRLIHKQ